MKIIYTSLTFLIIIFLVSSIYFRIRNNNLSIGKAQYMPAFTFQSLDSADFTQKNLSDKSTIIIYFNSECTSCYLQVHELIRYKNILKDINIMLVSEENIHSISVFNQKLKLDKPPFFLLKSVNNSFYKIFGEVTTPSIFVYNSEKQLVKIFKGETQIQAIIKYLP